MEDFIDFEGKITDEMYFASDRLSRSDFVNLLTDSHLFQMRKSKNREFKTTPAMEFGKLVHCKILEPEAYKERYLILEGSKGKIVPVENKLVMTNPDLFEFRKDPNAKTCVYKGSQQLVSKKVADKVLDMANEVNLHPDTRAAFVNGKPEICVFWTCPKYKLKLKAKIDYLKISRIVDYKTTSKISKTMTNEIINYHLHFQAFFYLEAINQAIAQGLVDKASGVDPDWIEDVKKEKNRYFHLIFQSTAEAPYRLNSTILDKSMLAVGEEDYHKACEKYLLNIDKFEDGEIWKDKVETQFLTVDDLNVGQQIRLSQY